MRNGRSIRLGISPPSPAPRAPFLRRPASPFPVPALAAGLLCACSSPSFPPSDLPSISSSSAPLPLRAWWAEASTAPGDVEKARAWGVNTLIVENDVGVGWDSVIDGLATYDFSGSLRRGGSRRADVEKLRDYYRAFTAAGRRNGVACYVMCPELHLPPGFAPASYENPELWTLLRERLREVFRALPDLAGFTLYLCEGPVEVVHLPGAEPSQARRIGKLVDTLWAACRAEKRKLMVSTFIHRPETLEAVAAALRGFPPDPDFSVLQYCCPNDWGLYALTNSAIGRVGPHPEILGFDYTGENWGQASHPFVQAEFMARRLREARARGANVAGLAGYVSWSGHSVFGTLNEANVHAARALAEEPGRGGGDILRAWCAERFPPPPVGLRPGKSAHATPEPQGGEGGGAPAAEVAAACLGRTQAAVFKAQHVFDFWVDTATKSGLPSLQEMDAYFTGDFFGEALAKWDARYAGVWEKIREPDEAFVAYVVGEKEEAIALCRRSLAELRAARDRFRPEDFEALERAFVFQELWARLWKGQMHAYFLRRLGRQGGWTPELKARLEGVLKELSAVADELEAKFGAGVFPHGPGRAREFVEAVRREL